MVAATSAPAVPWHQPERVETLVLERLGAQPLRGSGGQLSAAARRAASLHRSWTARPGDLGPPPDLGL